MPAREAHKQAELDSRTPEFIRRDATKPFGWPADHWIKWATITHALSSLGVGAGARVLDVGCGTGWTTLFLAESGLHATGVDLVPANIEAARERARRWGLDVPFEVHDAEFLSLPDSYDAVLVFDALHHCEREAQVVEGVARHLRPGGWVLFGEPTWLHRLSPHARATEREVGWKERGVLVRRLKRECRAAGLGGFRRFYEGTRPYESRTRGFAGQLVRLVGANFAVAPQMQIWLAARRPSGPDRD
jgi:SAM-dependent methyltransferase